MTRDFEVKWDGWLLGVLAGSVIVSLFASVLVIMESPSVIVALIVISSLSLGALIPLSLLWPGVHYTLRGDSLDIRCGLFRWHIAVSQIKQIVPTRTDWTSSPAPSLDRLRIDYMVGNIRKHLLISPTDKTGLMDVLASVEPRLEASGDSLIRKDGVT